MMIIVLLSVCFSRSRVTHLTCILPGLSPIKQPPPSEQIISGRVFNIFYIRNASKPVVSGASLEITGKGKELSGLPRCSGNREF